MYDAALAGDASVRIRLLAASHRMGSDIAAFHALGQFAHLLGGAVQLRVQVQRPAIELQRSPFVAIILLF
jgi:hypothetical protein